MSVQTPELAFLAQDPALAPFIKEGVAVVVWSADGSRALWASDAARPLVEDIAPGGVVRAGSPVLERLSALASGLAPRKGVRLERLRLDPAPGAEVLTCACHMLALPNGTTALLTAVVGRLPATFRPLRDDEPFEASAIIPEPLAPVDGERMAEPTSASEPAQDAPSPQALPAKPAEFSGSSQSIPAGAKLAPMTSPYTARADGMALPDPIGPQPQTPVHEPDAETDPVARVRMLARTRPRWRFVWETDAAGRFSKVADELSEALGSVAGDILGQTWWDLIGRRVADPSGQVAEAFEGRVTWTARDIPWRVASTDLAVLVDLSAVPVSGDGGAFGGYRGFGICRLDTLHRFGGFLEEHDPAPLAPAADPQYAPASSAGPGVPLSPPVPVASVSPVEVGQPAPAQPNRPAGLMMDGMRTAAAARFRDGMRASVGTGQAQPARPRTALPVYGSTAATAEPKREQPAPPAVEAMPPAAPAQTAAPEAAAPQPAPAPVASESPVQPAAKPAQDFAAIRHQGSGGFLPMRRITATPRLARSTDDQPVPQAAETDAAAPSQQAPVPVPPAQDAAAERPAMAPQTEPPVSATISPAEPKPPSPAKPLSAEDQRSLREIARVLGERRVHAAAPADEPAATNTAPAMEGAPARGVQAPAAPVAPEPGSSPRPVPAPAMATASAGATDLASDVLDRMPQALLVTRDRSILYANDALLDLVGVETIEELERSGGVEALLRGKVAQGTTKGAPLALVNLRGEAVPVDARIVSIVWKGKPATLLIANADADNDEHARRRAIDLDLRAKEATIRELTSILDTATDGVAVLDAEGRIVSLNRSAEALFGYEQAEVAGGSLTTLLAPESHAVALDYLEGLRANGVASILNDGRDVIGRVRQGGAIPLFMTIGPIADGADARYCAVLRDMSAWKKAETELVDARRAAERANSQKSDFLAKISHEIRTPLNAIIGFAEVMLEERFGPIGNDRYKDYLRDVHASGGHVISLVNDLLDLAKIEAGKIDLNFTGVDLNELVAGAAALLQPQATRERIVLRSSLQPNLPPVVADERSLRQVLLNILSNAVKFTDSGGQVIVSTAMTDRGEVALRVRDSGIGMSETEVKQALEPFRQLATTRRGGGTGLGLPLTKAMVEANRGQFAITSAKGEGTLVEVIFPPTRVLAS